LERFTGRIDGVFRGVKEGWLRQVGEREKVVGQRRQIGSGKTGKPRNRILIPKIWPCRNERRFSPYP
jgi:hypothetical protein